MMLTLTSLNKNKSYLLRSIKNKLKHLIKIQETLNTQPDTACFPYLKELQEEELNSQFAFAVTASPNIC
jgi:hypothetical protein